MPSSSSQSRISPSVASVFKVVMIAILVLGLVSVVAGCGGKAPLVGKWHSAQTGETLQFTADGKMIVTKDGQEGTVDYTYKVEGANVAVSQGTYSVTVPYSIAGDVLTMTDPEVGGPVTYDLVK